MWGRGNIFCLRLGSTYFPVSNTPHKWIYHYLEIAPEFCILWWNDALIHPLYIIPYPPTEWKNWPINKVNVSKQNDDHLSLSIYPRIFYFHYHIINILVLDSNKWRKKYWKCTKTEKSFKVYFFPCTLLVTIWRLLYYRIYKAYAYKCTFNKYV